MELKSKYEYPIEVEIIYLIGSKYKGGGWNKFVKCFENWFYTEKEAIEFFNKNIEDNLRPFYAIFEAEIGIFNVKKVFDGKDS